MSNLDRKPPLLERGGRSEVKAHPVRDLIPGRLVQLGESTDVRRLLPTLGRRMVGAWCFIDHYGPDDISRGPGMQVPPHPHTGLQTVSWLLDGHVLHRDSIGSEQTLHPGSLGVMTAGQGIAHAEVSPSHHGRILHGAQLWVALPEQARNVRPAWEFHPELPVIEDGALTAVVFAGQMGGVASAATHYSPLVGVDVSLAAGADTTLPLETDFEYAVLTAFGTAHIDGVELGPGSLLYLGCGRSELPMSTGTASRLLLLGGEPFAEKIVMWWNLVGGNDRDIRAARSDWMAANGRFGQVAGYEGPALPAPPIPVTPLIPRGRSR